MKKIIGYLIFIAAFLAAPVCVHADDEEMLQVEVRTYEGETVLAKEGTPICSSVPLTFIPAAAGECYYSIREDAGEEFGEYMPMEQQDVTLYPKDDAACVRPAVRFRTPSQEEGQEEGGAWTESQIYEVVFDVASPAIEADDPDGLSGWYKEDGSIGFTVSDEESGICRIILSCNGSVTDECHDSLQNDEGTVKDVKVSFPVTDTGLVENEAKIECVDLAGNHSELSFVYRYDASRPDISIQGVEDGMHSRDDVKIGISGTDPDSEVSIDYVVETASGEDVRVTEVNNIMGEEEVVFDREGRYTLRAWAKDRAGNSSDEISVDFSIDRTAPVISLEGVTENVDVRSAAELSIDVSDEIHEGSWVDISLARTALDETETKLIDSYEMQGNHDIRKVNITSDGEYEISVVATDGAGNRSELSRRFRIDKTAPDITVSGISEGEVTSDRPVLRFGAGELFYGSTVLSSILEKMGPDGYKVVDSRDRVMSAPRDHIDIRPPDEGLYRLTCIAADRSGNTSSRTVAFTVDYTPPVIADLSDMDNRFFKAFSLPEKAEALVTDATAVSVDTYVNDEKLGDDEVIIREGKYVLNILAEDEAGNASEGSATFIVDHTAPQIVLSGCDRDGNVKKGSLLKVGLLEEGDTLKSVAINGRDVAVGSDNTADIAVDDYGQYSIAVKAEDEAGNVTDTKIRTNCYMYGKTIDMYLKGGKTITVTPAKSDDNDIDLAGLITGLVSVLSGVFALTYRTAIRK